MSKTTNADSVSNTTKRTSKSSSSSWLLTPLFAILLPVAVAALLYRLDPLDPVHLPIEELDRIELVAGATQNEHMLRGSEEMAKGHVMGPEDLVYDHVRGVIYTGCADGWIKRVRLNDSAVEDWVNTEGRPLGLAFDLNGDLIVADAYKGLLKVTSAKDIEVLVDEIDGSKFKLTDGVDVAEDGTIYFTDASYKYSLKDNLLDIMEGKPNGRFLSFHPTTKKTTLLAHDLYFSNGVAVSPDQHFVVFCETVLMRCMKYYIKGPKKGSIDKFCDLPAMPDNIHYDGQGQYWIGLATAFTSTEVGLFRYSFLRKALAIVTKYVPLNLLKNGGVIVVDLEGKPVAHYYDLKLSLTTGIKIGNHIYGGSIIYPFLLRLDIDQYPALSRTSSTKN